MLTVRRSTKALGLFIAGLVLSSCAALTGGEDVGLGAFEGGVAARANDGVVVTVEDLEAAVEIASRGQSTVDLLDTAALEQRITGQAGELTNLIYIAVVTREAESRWGITVSEADVDASVEEVIASFGGDQAFEETLAAQGATIDDVRNQQRVQLLVQAISAALTEDDPVTDEDVAAQYEARAAEFEQVDARHILVETEAEANDVLARLEAGEQFADLAVELSQDPGSGANGGSLGPSPRGRFVPEFEAAIWDGPATPGEVIGPVETQFGFHLIVVDEFIIIGRDEAEAQIRAELEATLGQDLFGAWFSQTISDADPQVAPRFGTWDRQSQAVVVDGAEPAPGA